ncbi:MAG: NAD(P)-binding protein [Candidatus Microthrix sp.]|nr:NAD(P)-binding protein [Candidatus Microthrix sp.]
MKHSTIIVGAGIGGLSAAWALRERPRSVWYSTAAITSVDTATPPSCGRMGRTAGGGGRYRLHRPQRPDYPNLVALFEHPLDVERPERHVSFAFTGGPAAGSRGGEAEYSGSLGGLLATAAGTDAATFG